MSGIGAPEILMVLLALLLMFGASRLPKLARSMGQASKEFKAGLKEGAKEEPIEGDCPFCKAPIQPDAKFCPGCAKPAEEVIAERQRQAEAAKPA